MKLRPLIILAATLTTFASAPARADSSLPPHFIDGSFAFRVPLPDPSNDSYYDELSDYGYDTSVFGAGLRMSGGFQMMPRLDLGIAGEYFYKKNGDPRRKSIGMRTHALQLGLFVRPHVHSRTGLVDLATRLEVGGMHSDTILRQSSMKELSPYLRTQIELVLGRRDLGAIIHLGYTVVGGHQDYQPYAAPLLGGLSFGAGMFHRF